MLKIGRIFKARDRRSLEELEQITDALGTARERYRRIFKGVHGFGFMDWDIVNRYVSWSGSFWSYLGYSEGDMAHLSNPQVSLEYIHEEDREEIEKAVNAAFHGNDIRDMTFRLRKKRGGYIWAECRFEIERDKKGWIRFISGVVFDITQLKKSEDALLEIERRHARIIQSSNDGIWEWTAQRGEFLFSVRCWQQLGYLDMEQKFSRSQDRIKAWRNLTHPDDLDLVDQALLKHFNDKLPYDVEFRMRAQDGSWRWIRSRGQMTYNSEGKPLRMSGTNMDITDLKKAEEGVLKAKEEAERANRAKSEFLSSMSHELRTPLNAILAYSQLLELDKNIGEVQRENNREIKRAGLHLKQLVGDVLDLAKIEAGNIPLSLEECHLFAITQECLLLLRSQVQKKQIKVRLQSNSNQDAKVLGSVTHLRQVVLNLISNAVKYNREAGDINIQLKKTTDLKLLLEISDTGMGIADSLQNKIFQPFSRLSSDSKNIEGSGVGLVITQKLVQQMSGEIGFSSVESEGSTFWIRLPLATAQSSSQNLTKGAYPEQQQEQRLALNFTEEKSILYIEDNLSNQKVMQQIIARFPLLNLHMEREGIRGVYAARAKKPDLILLDISLPGMDGYEILEIMKASRDMEGVPIVALSANAMAEDIARGKRLGFSDYLTKPIDVLELFNMLNLQLANPQEAVT